jgi:hypothetical protein
MTFSVPEDKGNIERKGHFDDIDDIRSNTMAALMAIPKNRFKIVLNGGLGSGIGA